VGLGHPIIPKSISSVFCMFYIKWRLFSIWSCRLRLEKFPTSFHTFQTLLHLSGIHQNHLSFVYDTPLLFFDSISVLYHAGALPDNVIEQNHHHSNHCADLCHIKTFGLSKLWGTIKFCNGFTQFPNDFVVRVAAPMETFPLAIQAI
jgi:hypothetical protein